MKPNQGILNQINLDPGGIVVTAKGNEVDFVSRFFTPQASIFEYPVTGSAHGSLIPYWSKRLEKKSMFALKEPEIPGLSLRKVLNFYIKGKFVRRQDKKISDPNLIERVMQQGTIIHIAMMNGDRPYQIPLNYGYKDNSFYIHSAREGKKMNCLKQITSYIFKLKPELRLKILIKRIGVVQITNV